MVPRHACILGESGLGAIRKVKKKKKARSESKPQASKTEEKDDEEDHAGMVAYRLLLERLLKPVCYQPPSF